ncbi:hypothetical protein FKM82_020624 [Ascaphus truei]
MGEKKNTSVTKAAERRRVTIHERETIVNKVSRNKNKRGIGEIGLGRGEAGTRECGRGHICDLVVNSFSAAFSSIAAGSHLFYYPQKTLHITNNNIANNNNITNNENNNNIMTII